VWQEAVAVWAKVDVAQREDSGGGERGVRTGAMVLHSCDRRRWRCWRCGLGLVASGGFFVAGSCRWLWV